MFAESSDSRCVHVHLIYKDEYTISWYSNLQRHTCSCSHQCRMFHLPCVVQSSLESTSAHACHPFTTTNTPITIGGYSCSNAGDASRRCTRLCTASTRLL